ncbi:Hypothetical predicted protein [Scomber scombrus]|uniref:Uncharacterized protein n=1 Tax=Scomber scombrus TaxID=13677 RepID=A0AAV1QFD5_SCOSC
MLKTKLKEHNFMENVAADNGSDDVSQYLRSELEKVDTLIQEIKRLEVTQQTSQAVNTFQTAGSPSGPVENIFQAAGSPSGPVENIFQAAGSLSGPMENIFQAAGLLSGPVENIFQAAGLLSGPVENIFQTGGDQIIYNLDQRLENLRNFILSIILSMDPFEYEGQLGLDWDDGVELQTKREARVQHVTKKIPVLHDSAQSKCKVKRFLSFAFGKQDMED